MKKLFVSMMVIAMSLSTFAAKSITLTLKGENGGTYYQTSVVLTEDAARNASYESGYDAERVSVEPSGVLGVMLYGFVESKKCEYIFSNNLDNIALGFTSNVTDVTYHLLINVDASFTANEYRLYDSVKDQYIALDGSVTDYVFTAAAGRVTVDNRFVVKAPAVYNVTLNNSYLATFSADEAVEIPTGLNAYAAEYQSLEQELWLHQISDYIPANTGVILYNPNYEDDQKKEFSLAKHAAVPAISEVNHLSPATAYDPNHEGYVYVLSGSGMCIYEEQGQGMKPNKAFLQLPLSAPAPARIAFRFSEEQGVENIAAEGKAVKFIENGRVFIKRGDKVYNLQGQLVK